MKRRRTVYVTDEELSCLKVFLGLLRTEQLPANASVTTSDDKTADLSIRRTEAVK